VYLTTPSFSCDSCIGGFLALIIRGGRPPRVAGSRIGADERRLRW
jgi:hypothetical protein